MRTEERMTYKIIGKQIRKSIARDRLEYKLQNFEEELWFDIKQAKAAYLPRHTKLKEKNGEVGKTNRRPHILADFFEEKQWGQVKSETLNENPPVAPRRGLTPPRPRRPAASGKKRTKTNGRTVLCLPRKQMLK